MKKRALLAVLIFAGLSGFTASCEILDECGTCELVTIDNRDDTETRGTPLPYCGEDLKNKKDSSYETVGDFTTYWDCY